MLSALPLSLPSLTLLPQPALIVSPDGAVTAANLPAGDLFRCDPIGCELIALVPQPARLWAAVEGLEPGAHLPLVPLEGRRADGVPFALDASVRVLDDGALLCLLRELDQHATSSLEGAFDHAPIGMALFNTDGEYVRVNAALCALLGRSDAELVGMRDQELTHPEDRQSDLDAAWRILRGELATWQCE